MRIGFYPKLAWDGIRKNKRMYLPYILACIGMVMMTYIITYLTFSDTISALPGGGTVQEFLRIGIFVLAFFSAIFLFYTNSFLIRRRMKEFGLYNILGMEKKNIAAILFWETFIVAVISICVGLFGGIAFSKLAEVGFINLLNGKVTYDYSISFPGGFMTAALFGAIFILLLLNSLRKIAFTNAISLLRSENSGEKPPKANWLFGILGVIILGAAYYLAVTIKDPISALGIFFIAVIMVIAATYLIMIAGSVLFCRILQKHKGYYYKPNHFVSVSSMVYRMKRNGAGLASICILVTMVLVMISTTSALFIGSEEALNNRCPREINISFSSGRNEETPDGKQTTIREISDEHYTAIKEICDSSIKRYGTKAENVLDYRTTHISGVLDEGSIIYDTDEIYNFSIGSASDVHNVYLVPLEDYNSATGQSVTLSEDEVLLYSNRTDYPWDVFGFVHSRHYRVKEHLKEFIASQDISMDIIPSLMVVVPDIKEATKGLDSDNSDRTYPKWNLCFDTPLDDDGDAALANDIYQSMRELSMEITSDVDAFCSMSVESRMEERADYYALYGGLFYLGVILSIVFIFAAVLIIYYKQLSEGYEDQSRFEIMQKVGMTKRDIRRSIRSQLLTVFFMPLLGAGLHLAFAFPLLEKIIAMFNLNNRMLFIMTTAGSFLVFALFYVIVYRITSNTYYNIVSGAKSRE